MGEPGGLPSMGVSQSQTRLKRLSSSGSAGKESACNVGDLDLIPGWEDALEKGKATHSSILAWVTNSRTQLSDFHFLINLAMFPFIVFHHNLHYF